jgi:hypothetical protein
VSASSNLDFQVLNGNFLWPSVPYIEQQWQLKIFAFRRPCFCSVIAWSFRHNLANCAVFLHIGKYTQYFPELEMGFLHRSLPDA